MIQIKRGFIYEFTPKTSFDGTAFALVLSADGRCSDNLIYIIILSKSWSPLSIELRNSAFGGDGVLYANLGKITCTERARLTREVSAVSASKMEKINKMIPEILGCNPLMMEAENKVYKELYHELLEKVTTR